MLLEDSSLPSGLRVYAVGDVHGRADLLGQLFAMIEEDWRADPASERRLVMLGDYSDRGPQSRQVIDLLIQRGKDPDWRGDAIFLRGNHDDWLQRFLSSPEEVGDSFLRWGGVETLASYGIDAGGNEPELRWLSNEELSYRLGQAVPAAHREFISGLKFSHEEGDYFFAHAGVRPGVPLDEQDPHDLIWIREEFHNHLGSFGKVIVHGHTPHDEVEVLRNRINLDTRAYSSGVLSAVVLQDRDFRFLQTGA